jgi:hypothetical protein
LSIDGRMTLRAFKRERLILETAAGLGVVRTVARKWKTAMTLSSADLLLVVTCWWMIGASSLIIALLASRYILRRLGANRGAMIASPPNTARQLARAARIGRAIGIAGRHAPFRADCYPQALTAALLCRGFGVPHAVQFGARFAAADSARAGKLEAHAWVSSGTLTVCGGQASPQRFGTVACFVHLPRSDRRRAIN